MLFSDRRDAGTRLAVRLERYRGADGVVLGLPRGGVPVAAAVAEALGLPLDVVLVRKLGVPFQPELALGAIGEGGVRVLNAEIVRATGVEEAAISEVEAREREELWRRADEYRGHRPPRPVTGAVAIVVDDGIATGATARAACEVVRARGARAVVLAVPVAPPDWVDRMGDAADVYVAVETPDRFGAVGQWYRNFDATTDDEVRASLAAT